MEAKSITQRGATPVQFVNHLGQPLNVSATPAPDFVAPMPTRGGAPKPSKQSRGFEIVGIREKRLKAAEKRAADRRARWEARGPKNKAKEPPPWCAETWLSEQRLVRAMRETFAVKSAAELAAELLRKQGGWVRVSVLSAK